MSYAPHDGIVVSHDLLRIEPYDSDNVGYIYLFLKTVFGKAMMRSTKYGSIVKHMEPEHLGDVPIILFDASLRRKLNSKVKDIYKKRSEAYGLIIEANDRYVKGLGLKFEKVADEMGEAINAIETFGKGRRLDAFYYNPQARGALHALKATGHKIVPLKNVVDRIFNVPRFKHVYSATGVPYLDSEDLFKVNPEIMKYIPKSAKRNAERYFVKKNWLLMACSGQLYGRNGCVIMADHWHENKIVSNHVIRIVPRNDDEGLRPGYLQVALNNQVFGRPLVQKSAFGMEVPEISPADVGEIPIICPPSDLEDEISDCIQRANALRSKADDIENENVGVIKKKISEMLKLEI